jgi:hypothetical protein
MNEYTYNVIELTQRDSWDNQAISQAIEAQQGNNWEFVSLSFRDADSAILVFRQPKEYA